MMKKTFLATAILTATAFSASAMANTAPEYYLWGDAGTTNTRGYESPFENTDRNLDQNIYGMGLGLVFNQDKFAEFGYMNLATSEFSFEETYESGGLNHLLSGDMENEHNAFVVRLGKIAQWNPYVAFTIHLGGAYVSSETTGTIADENLSLGGVERDRFKNKETNLIGLAGIGFNFNISENLDARVRFERMINVDSGYDNYHMDNLTAGIAYRF